MTDSPLHRFFAAVGAERLGGEWVAPCPLYADRHRDGADPRKVVIGPGRSRRCLVYCRSCGRDALGDILTAWGVRSDDLERWAAATPGWESADGDAAAEYDFDLLHRAYLLLLRQCPLTDADRTWLRRRGVGDDLADWCGYGSLRSDGNRTAAYATVCGGIGDAVKRVPGLYCEADLRGPGILTPCRGEDGRIRAIKVRLTDGGRTRMRLLTSRFSGGLAAVNDLHFPRPGERIQTLTLGCWVTEGERKADVLAASRYTRGERVVAVPGVGCVGKAVDWVLDKRRDGVTLAFDADAAGEAATAAAARELRRGGYRGRVQRVLWGGGPTASGRGGCKGVDDAIAANLPLRFEAVEVPESEAIGPPPHRPVSLATVRDVIGREPVPVETLYRQHPRLRSLVQAAIRGGELAFAKVAGVGGCVAVPELTAEEWQRWQSSARASSTASSGG